MQLVGYMYIFMAAVLWGLLGPMAKFAFADGVSPLEVAFWRAVTGGIFYLVHCVITRDLCIRKQHIPAFVLFGVLGVAVFFGSYQIAVRESGAALASVLLYTAPAWVALLARVVLGEALTPVKLIALVMAMAGAFCVCMGSATGTTDISLLGVGAGLVAGFTYALHYIFNKKYMASYSAAMIYMYSLPIGAAVLLPFVTFQEKSWTAWGAIIFLGFASTYLAYLCYCAGLKKLAATRVAITANLEPVVAATMAFVWWGEYFTPLGYLGSALVLAAVVCTILESKRV